MLVSGHPNIAGKLKDGVPIIWRGIEFLKQTSKRSTLRIASPAMIATNLRPANSNFQLVRYEVLINAKRAMVRSLNAAFADSGLLTEQIIEDCYKF
jgi:hypothetical protein